MQHVHTNTHVHLTKAMLSDVLTITFLRKT